MPARKNITVNGDYPLSGYTGKLATFNCTGNFDGATVRLQWRSAGSDNAYQDVGGLTNLTADGGDNFAVGGRDINVNISGGGAGMDLDFYVENIGSPQ